MTWSWTTPWRAYRCRCCRADCINRHDETCTRYRECRDCHRVPELDDDRPPVDRRAPGLLWACASISSTDASAGEVAAGAEASERHERAPAAADRKRGLAPDPAAGAQPPTGREGATSGGIAVPGDR